MKEGGGGCILDEGELMVIARVDIPRSYKHKSKGGKMGVSQCTGVFDCMCVFRKSRR